MFKNILGQNETEIILSIIYLINFFVILFVTYNGNKY